MAITNPGYPYPQYNNWPWPNQKPSPALTPTPAPNTFEWIRGGEAAVNAYQVQPGNTVRLMDADNPVLYVKTVDFTGKPYVETYDLVLRADKPATDESMGSNTEEIREMIAVAVKKEFDKHMNKQRKSQRKEESNG